MRSVHLPSRRRWLQTLSVALTLAVATSCTGAKRDGDTSGRPGQLQVATTTEIIADIARSVGGERVAVTSLVPPNGDPHSYEPKPADVDRIRHSDVTFTNHLLLEPQALIRAIDANIKTGVPNVSLAEGAEPYGARVIPLVENVGLDTIWLGLRVRGDGTKLGLDRSAEVRFYATGVEGPGQLVAYLTESLGAVDRWYDGTNGWDTKDVAVLPIGAHTHLNWAFTKPGRYVMRMRATANNGKGGPELPVGEAAFVFAVGVDPATVATSGQTVLGYGHTDLTVDLENSQIYSFSDTKEKTGNNQLIIPADKIVIEVPNKAITTVPPDPQFSFLGAPGTQVWQLPQAVLGKHVHGEIDPHLWQDVNNVKAYAKNMRDTFITKDPAGRKYYEQRTAAYIHELDDLHKEVATTLGKLPPDRRQLVTTHDAFGYLADAYGLTVAGFVVPNPAQEPSAADVSKLTETIRNLKVPAVFVEPNLVKRATVLEQVAKDQGVKVCSIYGDAFDAKVRTYPAMMRHNATTIARCLGGH